MKRVKRDHVTSGVVPNRQPPRNYGEAQEAIERAAEILASGLKYNECSGHDMPKSVARQALEALGVKPKDQPW